MLPEHTHPVGNTSQSGAGIGGALYPVSNLTNAYRVTATESADEDKLQIGDRVKPHTKYIRYLVKL